MNVGGSGGSASSVDEEFGMEKLEEERSGVWRVEVHEGCGHGGNGRRNTELTKVHDDSEVAPTKESKNMPSRVLVVEVEPPALVFANPAARTQAAGGALVVGEVTARVGVEGGRWPVRTRGLPSNDTRRGSHVLLDSPEVATSQRTSART